MQTSTLLSLPVIIMAEELERRRICGGELDLRAREKISCYERNREGSVDVPCTSGAQRGRGFLQWDKD